MSNKVMLIFYEDGSHMFTTSWHTMRHPSTGERGISVEIIRRYAEAPLNTYSNLSVVDVIRMGLHPKHGQKVTVVDEFSIKEEQ